MAHWTGTRGNRRRRPRVPKEIDHPADIRREIPTSMSGRRERGYTALRVARDGSVDARARARGQKERHLGFFQGQNGSSSQKRQRTLLQQVGWWVLVF